MNIISSNSMEFSKIDKEPFFPGYGTVYQGTRIDPTIFTIPGKIVIVNMDAEVDDVSWMVSRFDLDHCHKTNKIRGLLCNNCNQGLGGFRDNIESLERAIKYLG